MTKQKLSTKDITASGLVAALVFLATYFLKITTPNGYVHLGDCMIFLGVLTIGSKRGALAGGIGAALADAAGGYPQWVLPTFFIKAAMALLMGLFVYKLLKTSRFGWLIGAVAGGILQIVLYAVAKLPMYGWLYALTSLPGDVFQTAAGIGIAAVLITALNEGGVIKKLRAMYNMT